MRKIKLLLILVFAIFFVLLLPKNDVLAACGTFYIAQPEYARCINAEDDDRPINPHDQCTQNPNACCSTQAECEEVYGGGDDDDEDDEPEPLPYPESDEDCGSWIFDPSIQRRVCFALGGGSVISNAVQCSFSNECCRETGLCTKYYGCVYDEFGIPTGECEERYDGGAGQITPDLNSCRVNFCRPPDPDNTMAGRVAVGCVRAGFIHSAIGCISFEDAGQTASFFLRWAIGVGGGIALFLIGVSAIKIMTVKGDEKRLQDARDTLTAAIAGLAMLILSVFILRTATETLLNLF